MRRSLLALLHGPDGRSLAWALALLVALNAFVAGGHVGLEEAGPVVCSVAAHSPAGDGPTPPARGDPCCFTACISAATALPIGEAVALMFLPDGPAVFIPPTSTVAVDLPRVAGHGPRGPPSLA